MLRAWGAVADLQYNVLRFISPREANVCTGEAFAGRSKLELLGQPLDVVGKTVSDFGCGEGHECVELARRGARRVIGVDIRPDILDHAREALIRWRSDFKDDGATRFHEVAGGLNQMTIRRFEEIVQQSPLQPKWLECVPIRKLRSLHNPATREFTTSVVRSRGSLYLRCI